MNKQINYATLFESEKDCLNFERERENYYINQIEMINKNRFNTYKIIFREIFNKAERAKKKLYDNYCGGFWKYNFPNNSNGEVCYIGDRNAAYNLPPNILKDSFIWIDRE